MKTIVLGPPGTGKTDTLLKEVDKYLKNTDPNKIGLEIQPPSDNIVINSAKFDGLSSETESEDSVRTDETLRGEDEPIVILGEIKNDPFFDDNSSSFLTQVLLTNNNTDLGANPVVDSVVLSYTYYEFYGELLDFDDLTITKLNYSSIAHLLPGLRLMKPTH